MTTIKLIAVFADFFLIQPPFDWPIIKISETDKNVRKYVKPFFIYKLGKKIK